jgi:hypothetical protein
MGIKKRGIDADLKSVENISIKFHVKKLYADNFCLYCTVQKY